MAQRTALIADLATLADDQVVLAQLPPVGSVRRNPAFWSDIEVRRLAVMSHRQMTIAEALVFISREVGNERTPSKSALARAWQRLDLLLKQRPVTRKGR